MEMMKINRLAGKPVTEKLAENINENMISLKEIGVVPRLAIVRIGEKEDDLSYERSASIRCKKLGIEVDSISFPWNVTEEDFTLAFKRVCYDDGNHGILLLRPLPEHIDESKITKLLPGEKDVDGITSASLAGVFTGQKAGYPPCTAQACMEILKYYGIEISGKRVVVIGRSLVIGKPVAMMLLKENATVTICHTRTKDLKETVKNAEIVIAAAGVPEMLDGSFLSEGQIIIDVGIHVKEDGKLCGDVRYNDACELAAGITPVPGGVGTVTTSVLAAHVVEAVVKR